jgi:hypothetical protein
MDDKWMIWPEDSCMIWRKSARWQFVSIEVR